MHFGERLAAEVCIEQEQYDHICVKEYYRDLEAYAINKGLIDWKCNSEDAFNAYYENFLFNISDTENLIKEVVFDYNNLEQIKIETYRLAKDIIQYNNGFYTPEIEFLLENKNYYLTEEEEGMFFLDADVTNIDSIMDMLISKTNMNIPDEDWKDRENEFIKIYGEIETSSRYFKYRLLDNENLFTKLELKFIKKCIIESPENTYAYIYNNFNQYINQQEVLYKERLLKKIELIKQKSFKDDVTQLQCELKGRQGEYAIRAILNKFLSKDDFMIFNDIYVNYNRNYKGNNVQDITQIDHLLVHKSGATIVIETKNILCTTDNEEIIIPNMNCIQKYTNKTLYIKHINKIECMILLLKILYQVKVYQELEILEYYAMHLKTVKC